MFLGYTSCRLGEARSLVWGDTNLDGVPAHILLRAEATKDRDGRPIPLHSRLAQVLRDMRPDGVRADVKVFNTFPRPMMLDRDLSRAGITKRDALRRTVAFHSFRKTFQTMGVYAGINQQAAQSLLGHSDANHTAKIYTDIPALGYAEQVEKLPWLGLGATAGDAAATVRSALATRFRTFCAGMIQISQGVVFYVFAR